MLIPLIVVIERIRIAIRPITLSVRLGANIIAGHLLLSLCAGGLGTNIRGLLALAGQTLLLVLEIAVAVIQAYVFIILVALYSKDAFNTPII